MYAVPIQEKKPVKYLSQEKLIVDVVVVIASQPGRYRELKRNAGLNG